MTKYNTVISRFWFLLIVIYKLYNIRNSTFQDFTKLINGIGRYTVAFSNTVIRCSAKS